MPSEFCTYTTEQIIDFFEERLRGRDLSEGDYSSLIERVNELAAVGHFNLSQASIVLKGLSELAQPEYFLLGRLKVASLTQDLSRRQGEKPRQTLERLMQERVSDIIELIKNSANFVSDKSELSWNQEILSRWIDSKINDISPEAALSLLSAFTKIGYNREDKTLKRAFGQIARKARDSFKGFSLPEYASDFIYSLASANIFEELAEIIRRAKAKLSGTKGDIDSQSAQALLQADLFHREFCEGQALFTANEIIALREACPEAAYPIDEPATKEVKKLTIVASEAKAAEILTEQLVTTEIAENVSEIGHKKIGGKKRFLLHKKKKVAEESENVDELLAEFNIEIPKEPLLKELEREVNNGRLFKVTKIIEKLNTDDPVVRDYLSLLLTRAFNRFLASGKKFNRLLFINISEELIKAGASDKGSAMIDNIVKGKELFNEAVTMKAYRTATFIFSKIPRFPVTGQMFAEVLETGSIELVLAVARSFLRTTPDEFNNDLWRVILSISGAEEIADKFIEAGILPTDADIALEVLFRGVETQNEIMVCAIATPELLETEKGQHLALHLATSKGDVDMVHLLIALGADPNSRSSRGLDAINIAVGEEKLEMIDALEEEGIDIGSLSKEGHDLLTLAAIGLCDKSFEHLIKKGAKVGYMAEMLIEFIKSESSKFPEKSEKGINIINMIHKAIQEEAKSPNVSMRPQEVLNLRNSSELSEAKQQEL